MRRVVLCVQLQRGAQHGVPASTACAVERDSPRLGAACPVLCIMCRRLHARTAGVPLPPDPEDAGSAEAAASVPPERFALLGTCKRAGMRVQVPTYMQTVAMGVIVSHLMYRNGKEQCHPSCPMLCQTCTHALHVPRHTPPCPIRPGACRPSNRGGGDVAGGFLGPDRPAWHVAPPPAPSLFAGGWHARAPVRVEQGMLLPIIHLRRAARYSSAPPCSAVHGMAWQCRAPFACCTSPG